jgi:hypothetical protein
MRGERGRGLIGWRQDRTQRTDNHETDGGVGQNGRNEGRRNEKKTDGDVGRNGRNEGRTNEKKVLLASFCSRNVHFAAEGCGRDTDTF